MYHRIKQHIEKVVSSTTWRRRAHTLRHRRRIKLKLVAVARNEAAYLAEWICHHQYFGFDDIEVHYNNCSDNSAELAHHFEPSQVRFFNADEPFNANQSGSPQVDVYQHAFARAYKHGYSHIMFLDIDEFWVPADLSSSIQQWLHSHWQNDVVCFNWLNKVDEQESFGPVLQAPAIQVQTAQQIKSAYKTFLKPTPMNAHNVVADDLHYARDDNSAFEPLNTHFSRLQPLNLTDVTGRAFVIHRMYRSELEYIAMLSRGRPIGQNIRKSRFKDNRSGYLNSGKGQLLAFNHKAWSKYCECVHSRMQSPELIAATEQGRKHVVDAYNRVLQMIAQAEQAEAPILKRLLKNVSDEGALNALHAFERKTTKSKAQ